VVFDIKNHVMMNLKSNQFSGKESEDCSAHLTHFLDAGSIINRAGASEFDKRLRLFGHSLTRREKDCMDTLPCSTITTCDQLKREILDRLSNCEILGTEEGYFQHQTTRR